MLGDFLEIASISELKPLHGTKFSVQYRIFG